MSREEVARYSYKRSKSPCSICHEEDHKEQVCPWQICRKCGTKGHIQYTCPLEGTVDNYVLERNMAKVEKELIDIKNSLKTMNEFADKIGDDTDEAIKNLKGKIQEQLLPLMGEVYTSIGRERERKKQHEAEHKVSNVTRNRETGVAKNKEQENTSEKRQETGTIPKKRVIKDQNYFSEEYGKRLVPDGFRLDSTPPKLDENGRLMAGTTRINEPNNITAIAHRDELIRAKVVGQGIGKELLENAQKSVIARGIVKQEPIRGADPRDVLDKEEWEEMVDFLVFWDALDEGDEGRLEEEVKELHDKYPVSHTLNEHTEERDKKFLQLEKTRNTARIKSKATKEKTVGQGMKKETDTTDERWDRELQRRQLVRHGEKLAKVHGDGFADGLAKGMIDKEWAPENKDRADELLEGFYESIGLASDQEMYDIFANAKDFLKEAVSPYVAEAKERMALHGDTRSEAQLQEDGFNDGFIRGKTMYMDMSGLHKRGDSEDVDFMMDELYKDISLIRRSYTVFESRGPEREMQQIMHKVRDFLDETVMITIDRNMAVATGSRPTKDKKEFKFQVSKGKGTLVNSVGEGHISRRITRSLRTAETESNEQEENKVQTQDQTAATNDPPMEQSIKDE